MGEKVTAIEPLVFDEAARLNIVLWGDPQISSVNPEREKRFRTACEDLASAQGKADALVIAGDIAEFGRLKEYAAVSECLRPAMGKVDNFICAPGNHDIRIRPYKKQVKKFQRFMSLTGKAQVAQPGRHYYSAEINGFRFLVLGADRASFESAYLSKKQLEWLKDELMKAQDGKKPVFVVNHQTLKRRNGLPDTWLGKGNWRGSVGRQSDELEEILTGAGNVFFLTGHLHFGMNEHTFEECGGLKLIAAPTVACANHGDFSAPAQGLVLSVYDDRVRVRARLFSEGKYVDPGTPNGDFEIML